MAELTERPSVRLPNIFSAPVHCSRCGSVMSLVAKANSRGREAYFICAAARSGDDCKLTPISFERVLQAFIKAHPSVLGTPASRKAKFHKHAQDMENAVSELERRRAPLVEEYGRSNNIKTLRELTSINEEILMYRHLRARLDVMAPEFVHARAEELKPLVLAGPSDYWSLGKRDTIATLFRFLFSGMSLDPDTGVATLGWRHGGRSIFRFASPTATHHEAPAIVEDVAADS